MSPISPISQADIPGGIAEQRLWAEPNERNIIAGFTATKSQIVNMRNFWLNDLKRGALQFTVPWLVGFILTDLGISDIVSADTASGTTYTYPEGGNSGEDRNRTGTTGWTNVCLFTEVPRVVGHRADLLKVVELRFRATYQRV